VEEADGSIYATSSRPEHAIRSWRYLPAWKCAMMSGVMVTLDLTAISERAIRFVRGNDFELYRTRDRLG
jgi:hypothetical protein